MLSIYFPYVINMDRAEGPTLTCPAAQTRVLHRDMPRAAYRQTYCHEMFGKT